jgi:hypothetical protein
MDMLTLIVTIAVTLLMAWALIKKPEALTISLAIVLVLAVLSAQYVRGDSLRSILMGIDAFGIIAAWAFWRCYNSSRAAQVVAIGMLKVTFGIAAAVSGLDWSFWAAGNNALFVVQVLIAGDFANGFMAWLGRGPDGTGTRSRGVLGYLERLP